MILRCSIDETCVEMDDDQSNHTLDGFESLLSRITNATVAAWIATQNYPRDNKQKEPESNV